VPGHLLGSLGSLCGAAGASWQLPWATAGWPALALANPVVGYQGTSGTLDQGASGGGSVKLLSTTLVGRVVTSASLPVPNAVVVTNLGGNAATNSLGEFALSIRYPVETLEVRVTAVALLQGQNYLGTKIQGSLQAFGDTPVGDLVIGETGQCSPAWLPTFGGQPGANDTVFSLTTFDDGSGAGPALIVGGSFTIAGGVNANRVAKWNGKSWSALGNGLSTTIFALTVYDDGSGSGPALIAGGGNVFRWNGSSWSTLGSGVTGPVRALTTYDDGSGAGPVLIAGGPNVSRWNGSNWSTVGSGVNGPVNALTVFDDGSGAGPALIAGGDFTLAGGAPASRIARWDGSAWSALGQGIDGLVLSLAVFDDSSGGGPALIAGGNFTLAGAAQVNNIASWDGDSWSALGLGLQAGLVNALTVYEDAIGGGQVLLAGGAFLLAGGTAVNRIAQWTGESWLPAGGGTSSLVNALAIYDDGSGDRPVVVAGGWFTAAGGKPANRVAQWDGTGWDAVGPGFSNSVFALTTYEDGSSAGPELVAAGFAQPAKWNGEKWSNLGSGTDGWVNALTVYDDGSGALPALVAGGNFRKAGGVETNRIAKWDGSQWSALGSGMNDWVNALAVFDDGSGSGPALIAAGLFTIAGNVPANRIAKWDGTAWSPLGSGMNAAVNALTLYDDGSGGGTRLIAGGEFVVAGGVAAQRVAAWDGTTWSALGTGPGISVNALAVYSDGSGTAPILIAGGGGVRRWNGNNWLPLGTGLNHTVRALAVYEAGGGAIPALIAAGFNPNPNTESISIWNGTAWSVLDPLGQFVGGVRALAAYDNGNGTGQRLFAGGGFVQSPAGDSFIAQWGCNLPLPGFSLTFAGSGSASPARLGVQPSWNGKRIVPQLQLTPPGIARVGQVLLSEPGPEFSLAGVTGGLGGSGGSPLLATLPLPESGQLTLPVEACRCLYGREVQVQAVYLVSSDHGLRFSNALRLRIDR
jgi:hypothetical protein